MLWLGVHLPDLPLAIFLRGGRLAEPMAVSHGQGREQRVLIANRAAESGGVRAGMRVSAAQALVRGLRVLPQEARAESRALAQLAAWCGQFTSFVCLAPPQALLLEVQGSLTLFGGLEALLARLRRGLVGLGYSGQLAVAPTPLAASWLARAGVEARITTNQELASPLSRLSLSVLDLTTAQIQILHDLGVRTVGECRRLPRDGLTRRLGADLVLALDRAHGSAPDPRAPYVAPARFKAALAIPGAIDNTEGLLFPLNRLIQELGGVLTARGAGVTALTLTLRHPRATPTWVELGLVAATRDAKHLTELFRERLARVALPEPVEEIILAASRMVPLAQTHQDFFSMRRATEQSGAELIERLRARLGERAVQGIAPVADHRPERAWRYAEPGQAGAVAVSGARPLWLLPTPVTLESRNGHPWLGEALTLEGSRERIESGWWDGRDIARDYFIARNRRGECFWIYRELATQRWWLHGVFG
ncbi:MAG: Y-family DNA polymerase [Sulfuricaulis sp.]